MRINNFTTVSEGLEILKKAYFMESETTEGEFADYLVEHKEECFDSSMAISLYMEAIQLFREWAHDRDELETENFSQISAEVNYVLCDGIQINEFQDYVYSDNTPVKSGVRVGVEILSIENEIVLELDPGIFFA